MTHFNQHKNQTFLIEPMDLATESFEDDIEQYEKDIEQYEKEIPFFYDDLDFIFESSHQIDSIILNKHLSIHQKKDFLVKLFGEVTHYYKEIKLQITSNTISELLLIKEETKDFFDLFSIVMQYCLKNNLQVFTYDHLYNLVLQVWMDLSDNTISTEFRKALIMIGFGGKIPKNIFRRIKANINTWLINTSKNSDIFDLVVWICSLDKTKELMRCKILYEKTMKESMEVTKSFQKLHNMTLEEYNIQQLISKKNGQCKYFRLGKICPHDTRCIFYHGKLEETYGIQPCRHGPKCAHFASGGCKFIHDISKKELQIVSNFYSNLQIIGDNFLVAQKDARFVDDQCITNPFIILKRQKSTNTHVVYSIPVCSCTIINEYGIAQSCDKPVRFMTKKNNKRISNFYCCYEHMNTMEPNSQYVVKQNVLDKIPLKINEMDCEKMF